MNSETRIIIVGGGMVGASLAVALASTCRAHALRIDVVESFDLLGAASLSAADAASYQPSFDARSTALSYGSKCVYESLGLWETFAKHAEPIRQIHVSEKGRFGSTHMTAEQEGLSALGYVTDNRWLGSVLLQSMLELDSVTLHCPTSLDSVSLLDSSVSVVLSSEAKSDVSLQADLLIIADGMRSATCDSLGIEFSELAYNKVGLVTNVESQQAHQGRAFERFTPNGPLALLPMCNQAVGASKLNSVVWTMDPEPAEQLIAADDDAFLQALQDEFGYRLGRLEKVGQRFNYPLALVTADEQIRNRVLVMGNAAHALHPVAGQGFNLALRGVARLAARVASGLEQGESPGSLTVLSDYLSKREDDQFNTIRFSHLAATIFTSADPAIGLARDLSLLGLDVLPTLKSLFVQQAAGLSVR